MENSDQVIVIYRAGSLTEAQFLCGLLANQGIDARAGSGSLPHPGLGAITVEVFVRAADQDRAAEVVEMYEDQRFESPGDEDDESDEEERDEAADVSPSPAAHFAERSVEGETILDRGADVFIVLAVLVIPGIWGEIAYFWGWQVVQTQSVPARHVADLVYSSSWIFLVFYLMSRRPEPWSTFGVVPSTVLPDLIVGGGLGAVTYVGGVWMFGALTSSLSAEEFRSLFAPPVPGNERPDSVVGFAALLIASALWGLAFELTLRAYLLPRFEMLLHSTWKALLLVTLLWMALRISEGPAGLFYNFVSGLTFGAAFCLFRRLWPVAVAQTCITFVARL